MSHFGDLRIEVEGMSFATMFLYSAPLILILLLPLTLKPSPPLWSDRVYKSSLDRCDAIKSFISRGKAAQDRGSVSGSPLTTAAEPNEDTSASIEDASTKSSRGKTILDWASLEYSINAIHSSLRLYGSRGVIVAFNGGKDATIVLDLFTAMLADYYRTNSDVPRLRPRAVYFLEESSEFKDVQEFVEKRRKAMDLDLTICAGSFTECIASYLSSLRTARADDGDWVKHPAFLLGVRRGDPRSESLSCFEPSSTWVKSSFMRVHPILEWNYGMVWDYFDLFKGEYCPLYDQGYTSLGKINETGPNLYLKATGSSKAKDLVEWERERGGRDSVVIQAAVPQT